MDGLDEVPEATDSVEITENLADVPTDDTPFEVQEDPIQETSDAVEPSADAIAIQDSTENTDNLFDVPEDPDPFESVEEPGARHGQESPETLPNPETIVETNYPDRPPRTPEGFRPGGSERGW